MCVCVWCVCVCVVCVVTDSSSLQALGQHHDVVDFVLPDHLPVVSYGIGHGTWAQDTESMAWSVHISERLP